MERTYHFKHTLEKKERFAPGHRLCAGCGAGIAVRGVLRALREEDRAVVGNATGCLEVSSFLYPYTAYEDSYIHTAFESAGASLSGVEAAYNALKRKGKIDGDFKFITFGGDGGTYDIGFQSLSGAMERGHDLTYVCYDNEAYMNTGIQRSSSTPRFARATTSPVGTGEAGQAAGQEGPDRHHRRPQHPLCGPDHLHRQLPGPVHQGEEGHLHPRPRLSQRHGPLSPGLGVPHGEAAGDLPPGGGDLRLAPLRGGKRRLAAELRPEEEAPGGGLPSACRAASATCSSPATSG